MLQSDIQALMPSLALMLSSAAFPCHMLNLRFRVSDCRAHMAVLPCGCVNVGDALCACVCVREGGYIYIYTCQMRGCTPPPTAPYVLWY